MKYLEKKIQKYKVRNWKQYNQSLINRGNLHLWIDEDSFKNWFSQKSNKRGRPDVYSDNTIMLCLTIRFLFKLPLRATQGFFSYLLKQLEIDLPIPSYTQVCRRSKTLNVPIAPKLKKGEEVHILIDSTGLKVYGEGEWKTKVHGVSKRRTWKKLHLCVDDQSLQILDSDLTKTDVHDSEFAINAMKNLENRQEYNVSSLKADGAYDTHRLYFQAFMNKIRPIIPPRKTAKTLEDIYANPPPEKSLRDQTIESVRELGEKEWKKQSGYHRRSRVETMMYRYKQLIGGNLKSRITENQYTEHRIACNILNMMAFIGLPQSVKV